MADNNTPEASNSEETFSPQEASAKKKFDFSRLNTLAVVSLAAGISGVGALIAVITGHVSLAQIRRTEESGKALAIIGTVLGYLHLVGVIIFTVLAVVSSAFLYSRGWGMMPGGHEFMEFRKGFDGMHMWGDR